MPSAATLTRPATKRAAEEARDYRIERLLRDNGFTAAQLNLNVHLGEIDEEASLKNQARVGQPISEATVQEYVTYIENGDEFPPMVVWEPRDGAKLRTVDGNHRFQAYKRASVDTANMYIIKGGRPQDITRLSMIINKPHGLKLSENDKIHHALYLIHNGKTAEEAAADVGLKVYTVRAARKKAEADSRALGANVNMRRWEKVNASAKGRLNAIKTDEVFKKVVQLVLDAGLDTNEINAAVTELSNIGSFNDQLRYVEALREINAERIQAGGNPDAPMIGRQARSAKAVASMAISQVRVLPSPNAITERMTDDDKAAMLPKVQEGIERLTALRDALKA